MPKRYVATIINDLNWFLDNGTKCLNAVEFMADGARYTAQDGSCLEISEAYVANNPPHIITDHIQIEKKFNSGLQLKETKETKQRILLSTHIWNIVWKHKNKPKHGFWKKWDEKEIDYAQPGTDNILKEKSIWLPIDEYSYNNPWHIWIDQLSKLCMVYSVYGNDFKKYPILVPFKNKYIEEAIALINPQAKIIEIPKGNYWYCRELIVPTVTNIEDGIVHPLAVLYLRNILNRFTKADAKKKLYISRKNAKLRGIENEEQVIKLLERRGYETVFPEKLSVEEQMKLFGEASHIVGVHGAGLINMIASPKDCYIIELYHKDRNKKVYPILARHCGHHMTRLECGSIPVSVKEKANTKLKDQVNLIVDCKLLDHFIR
jgi:hypothetical protein